MVSSAKPLGTSRAYGYIPTLLKHHRNHGNVIVDARDKLHNIKTLSRGMGRHENQVATKLSPVSFRSADEDFSKYRKSPRKYLRSNSDTQRRGSITRVAIPDKRTPEANAINNDRVQQRELKDVLSILLHSIFNELHGGGSSESTYHLPVNKVGLGKHAPRSRSISHSMSLLRGMRSQELFKHVHRRSALLRFEPIWKTTSTKSDVAPRRQKLREILGFIVSPFGLWGAISHARAHKAWPMPENMNTWQRIINAHMRKSQ